jgi:acyl-coenzyme A thioesterase PaaI-like protein
MSEADPTRTDSPTQPTEAAASIDPASHLEQPVQVDVSRHAEAEPEQQAEQQAEQPAEPQAEPQPEPEVGPFPGHLQLPHSATCLVCGRTNPQGLKLDLFVDPDSGVVRTKFLPTQNHTGFAGVVHGGAIATILDEAMVWAATWKGRRFAVCGELMVRFRQQMRPDDLLRVEAIVEFSRPKLVEVAGKVFDEHGKLLATGLGKYVPVTPEQHRDVLKTLIDDPATLAAKRILAQPI